MFWYAEALRISKYGRMYKWKVLKTLETSNFFCHFLKRLVLFKKSVNCVMRQVLFG